MGFYKKLSIGSHLYECEVAFMRILLLVFFGALMKNKNVQGQNEHNKKYQQFIKRLCELYCLGLQQ